MTLTRMYVFLGLILVSLVHFHVASSSKLSDQYIEIDFDQLQKGQQVSTAITKNPRRYIQSCNEAHTSGVYELRLSTKSVPFTAYCDVESLYGKWLVFQQRVDGSVDFNRSWVQYRDGFGAVGESTEFWLGLEKLYQVTLSGSFELAIELKNETGWYGFARYKEFAISGEADQYKIYRLGSYSGSIGDKLGLHAGEFKTYDRSFYCDNHFLGGWWFNNCEDCFLNGPYSAKDETGKGIYWRGWTNAASFSRMMIRHKQEW
ncbi:ficolin-3 [Culex quinquefasciatus]|uniref:ficolin-3 n=1 Tax=Culex quinquefasciatus TaxID=7176 RepID=UPI0018E2BFFC|nr:ficolin-3 [Culex quinquefasciatus]